jgi:hypothetical protein
MSRVVGAIFAALHDFHVLDAAGLTKGLEKPGELIFVPPHPKRDHVGLHHVVAGITGDLVFVVDGDETAVDQAVDRDIVGRRFEHLAQHRLAGLQPEVIAFSRRRGLGAQVYFADEQALVLGQRRDLLGKFPPIAHAMDCSYLRQDHCANDRCPVDRQARIRIGGVHRVAEHRDRSACSERRLAARTPRKQRARGEEKQHDGRDQHVAVAVDHCNPGRARDNRHAHKQRHRAPVPHRTRRRRRHQRNQAQGDARGVKRTGSREGQRILHTVQRRVAELKGNDHQRGRARHRR